MLGMRKVELALNGEEESNGPTAVVALDEGKSREQGQKSFQKQRNCKQVRTCI